MTKTAAQRDIAAVMLDAEALFLGQPHVGHLREGPLRRYTWRGPKDARHYTLSIDASAGTVRFVCRQPQLTVSTFYPPAEYWTYVRPRLFTTGVVSESGSSRTSSPREW